MRPRKNLSAIMGTALPGVLTLVLVGLSMGGCDLSSLVPDDGSGTGTPAAQTVRAVQPTFAKPVANVTAPEGMVVQISWFATSQQKTVVSQLYYDRDGLADSGDEVLLTQTSKAALDYSANVFNWDTTGMTPRQYRLLVVCSDGVNNPVTVYSNYTVTVTDSTPDINVTEPMTPVSARPAENVVIKWAQYNPLAASTVTLCYDDDTDRANGYIGEIVEFNQPMGSTGGTYTWNVPAIAAGQYYVLAEMAYDGETYYDYSTSPVTVTGPGITLLAPTSDVTWHGGGTLSIRYQVTGAASGATIRLFREAGDGTRTTLTTRSITSSAAVSWTWTSGQLPAGEFRIGGTVIDGVNDPDTLTAYANGTVTDAGPSFQVTAPADDAVLHAGDTIAAAFTYALNGGTASVTFYMDMDTNSANGFLGAAIGQATGLLPAASAGTATLTIPDSLAVGTYYIAGVFDNGTTPLVDYVGAGVGGLALVGPQLTLTGPTETGNILPGTDVQITWSNAVPDSAGVPATPTVRMFYTTNKADAGTYQDIVAAAAHQNPNTLGTQVGSGPGRTYTWTIPAALTGGPWYVGAIVTDENGDSTPATWAPCAMTMITRDFFARDLGLTDGTAGQQYADAIGRTIRGFSPNGQLGKVAAHVPWKWVVDPKDSLGFPRRQPGISTNGDLYDDFVVTAPTGDSYHLERFGAGESYLVLSDPAVLFGVPAVSGLRPVVVSATGSSALPGALFPGVAQEGDTAGIGSVALSRDADGDGTPEIVFGIPYTDKIWYSGQDYDPWDDFVYQTALAAEPDASPDADFLATRYADRYRRPYVSTAVNRDGSPRTVESQEDWRNVSAGMVVAVAGRIPAISQQTTPARGSAEMEDIVIPLDGVGQPDIDNHERVVEGTLTDMRGPDGVRFYCPWWFADSYPHYAEHTGGSLDWVQTPNDAGYFGDSLIEADLDGDGRPEWIANQPFDPESVAGDDEGWLHVIWSSKATLWNAPYDPAVAPGAWQNEGWVRIDTVDIDITTDEDGNEVGRTVTSTTGTPVPAPAYTWGAWSWPYAYTYGHVVVRRTTTTTDGVVTDITWTKTENDQDRHYCWPVVSDYILGDQLEAPNGTADAHLGGLGNVGDFNGDFREDFTVGAPQGAPGGLAGAGVTYLVFGRPSFGSSYLYSVGRTDDQSLAGIRIAGEHVGDKVGAAQASAGDFNGDGLSDWIIGVPGYDDATGGANSGCVAIIYGTPYLQGRYVLSDVGTAKLPGVIIGGESAGAAAGTNVSGVGDVDGDGYDDVVVIAPGQNWTLGGTTRTAAGVAYLIYGGPDYTGTMNLSNVGGGAMPGMIYVGPHNNEALWTAAPAGDVNDDGYADFLIGNPNYNIHDASGATLLPKVGEVYLIRGGARLTP